MVRENLESETPRVGTLMQVIAVSGAVLLYCAYLFARLGDTVDAVSRVSIKKLSRWTSPDAYIE
ncbi:hypothetical protein EMIT0P258_140081 [Pseudomonas sp. IT-P258]